MKKIILFFGLLLSFASASAQGSLEVGNVQVNAGFGFSNWGIPVYIGADYGLLEDVTIGAEISYRSKSYQNVNYSSFGFITNGNYHFNNLLKIPSEFDVYAGANIGYYHWSNNAVYTTGFSPHYSSGLGWGLQVGGRYYFNDNLGVNLELGGGNAVAGKIGVTYIF